ncbi:phage holin family protein [Yinghuangia aomiensis]
MVLTLGLFLLVINAAMLRLIAVASSDLDIRGLGAGLAAASVMAVVGLAARLVRERLSRGDADGGQGVPPDAGRGGHDYAVGHRGGSMSGARPHWVGVAAAAFGAATGADAGTLGGHLRAIGIDDDFADGVRRTVTPAPPPCSSSAPTRTWTGSATGSPTPASTRSAPTSPPMRTPRCAEAFG